MLSLKTDVHEFSNFLMFYRIGQMFAAKAHTVLVGPSVRVLCFSKTSRHRSPVSVDRVELCRLARKLASDVFAQEDVLRRKTRDRIAEEKGRGPLLTSKYIHWRCTCSSISTTSRIRERSRSHLSTSCSNAFTKRDAFIVDSFTWLSSSAAKMSSVPFSL